MSNKKEQIKSRMLKNAASQWGIPANEIEMSFDPIISLLLGACASEIEKVSNKINESESRVTEKIIQLMTPDTIFGPKPSHSIMRTLPTEDSIIVDTNFLFSYKKKNTEKASNNFREVFFSPIQDFKVVKASLNYMVFGSQISEVDETKELTTLFRSNKEFIDKSTLYLGITSESKSISLKDSSIYFELQDLEVSTLFYHHLKNAKWFVNEKEVKVESGFGNDETLTESNYLLDEDSGKVANIIDEVKNNYSRYFITIKDNFETKKEIPDAFNETISNHKIAIDENTFWLKVVFPRVIDESIIKTIYCALNSFPVVNRRLEEFSYQLKEFVNIVPIITSNLFLDIKSITNLENKKYKLLNRNISNNKKGIYSLRTDNLKKIDNRKAKEYIIHLIELLKDESASFSYLDNDFLQSNLKSLNQIISLLENKVEETVTNEKIETNYLAIEPYKPKDTLLVSFWNTDGSFANNIKYGSVLKNYKAVDLDQKSTSLVTSTYGGRNSLNMQERLQAYRRTLVSRDKIVTKEDIRLICFEFFGDKIKAVKIKNGYTIDVALNKGIINCIEIILTPNSNLEIDAFEWDFIKNNLLLFLEKKATSVFPFIIKKE